MQIFISHAPDDEALAAELTDLLESSGIKVWNASRSFFFGDNRALPLATALAESDIMVALFTRSAKSSETVQQDALFALTQGQNYRGRVIPVLIDYKTFQVGADVPWILMKLNPIYVNGVPRNFSPVVERVLELSRGASYASA